MSFQLFTISDTSPDAAGTALGDVVGALDEYDWFAIDATIGSPTGGTLDVYLQREVASDAEVSGGVWADWLHFAQTAAGGAATKWSTQTGGSTSITAVGNGTDASGAGVALAASTFLGGHPGNKVRAVYVAGAGTSAGAAVVIRIKAWKRRV